MKKFLLIFCCLIIFLILLTGCNTKNHEDELKIIKNIYPENNISGMGVDYTIENIQKNKYNVNFYAKEYKKGKFVKDHRLYSLNLNVDNKNKKIPISVYQEDKDIKLFINSHYQDITLDFFENADKGIALSSIETEKPLKLNEDIPIALYSIADEDNSVSSVNIENDYELGLNEKDLVIFINIKQSN